MLGLAVMVAATLAQGEPSPANVQNSLSVTPTAKVNSKFVEQYGTDLSYGFAPRDGIRIRASLLNTWFSGSSAFVEELLKVRETSSFAARTQVGWALLASLELAQFRGEIANRIPIEAFLSVGMGGGSLAVEIATSNGAFLADAGLRPVASATIGTRVRLSQRMFLTLKATDTFTSANVTTLNGCNSAELGVGEVIDDFGGSSGSRFGSDSSAYQPSTCNLEAFPSPEAARSAGFALRDQGGPPDTLHLTTVGMGLGVAF